MNPLDIKNILQNIQESTASTLNPLLMQAEDVDGQIHKALAINEVSIFRKTNQAAKFRIEVNGVERMSELVADGALVATPAGSSAYNLSAGGHILPLESNMLCLTLYAHSDHVDGMGHYCRLQLPLNLKYLIQIKDQ